MVARHWRGWTKANDADAYESLLKARVLPALKEISGYRGGYILRSDGTEESEFVVVNLFDSLDAVRKFAGTNYHVPVFEPEAKALLSRFDSVANHYEVRVGDLHGVRTKVLTAEFSPRSRRKILKRKGRKGRAKFAKKIRNCQVPLRSLRSSRSL